MIEVKDLVKIDQYLDRRELADRTGIHYQTLAGKINRFKNGRSPTLSLDQSKAIEQYLAETHDLLHIILSER